MSKKEDLKRKIQGLQDELSAAIGSLNAILIAEFELKPGMVVDHSCTRGGYLEVSRIHMKYGEPRAWGRKTLKNGKLGEQEFEIYGHYKIIPVSPTQD